MEVKREGSRGGGDAMERVEKGRRKSKRKKCRGDTKMLLCARV